MAAAAEMGPWHRQVNLQIEFLEISEVQYEVRGPKSTLGGSGWFEVGNDKITII